MGGRSTFSKQGNPSSMVDAGWFLAGAPAEDPPSGRGGSVRRVMGRCFRWTDRIMTGWKEEVPSSY